MFFFLALHRAFPAKEQFVLCVDFVPCLHASKNLHSIDPIIINIKLLLKLGTDNIYLVG